jgi:hypothetical protein
MMPGAVDFLQQLGERAYISSSISPMGPRPSKAVLGATRVAFSPDHILLAREHTLLLARRLGLPAIRVFRAGLTAEHLARALGQGSWRDFEMEGFAIHILSP